MTHYSLRTAHYSLLTTHYPLLATHYLPLNTHYSLLTTHYTLLTTHCSLLTAHYPLLIAHYSLHTIHFSALISLTGQFVFDEYRRGLERAGLLDLGDLQLLALELMAKPSVLAHLRQRYAHVSSE